MDPTDVYTRKSGRSLIQDILGARAGGGLLKGSGHAGTAAAVDQEPEIPVEDMPALRGGSAAPAALPPGVSPEVPGVAVDPGAKRLPAPKGLSEDPPPDLTKAQKWSGEGGWQYEYKPGDDGGTIIVHSPHTGREIPIGPSSRHWAPIMEELQAGNTVGAFEAAKPKASGAKSTAGKPTAPKEAPAPAAPTGNPIMDAVNSAIEEPPEEAPAPSSSGGRDADRDNADRDAVDTTVSDAPASRGPNASTLKTLARGVETAGHVAGMVLPGLAPLAAGYKAGARIGDLVNARADQAVGDSIPKEAPEAPPEPEELGMRPLGENAGDMPDLSLDQALAPIKDPFLAARVKGLLSRDVTDPNSDALTNLFEIAEQLPPQETTLLQLYIRHNIVDPIQERARASAQQEQQRRDLESVVVAVDPRVRDRISTTLGQVSSGSGAPPELNTLMGELSTADARRVFAYVDKYGKAPAAPAAPETMQDVIRQGGRGGR